LSARTFCEYNIVWLCVCGARQLIDQKMLPPTED